MYAITSGSARGGIELAAAAGSAGVATKAGAWIIEDDSKSEFGYGSRPLPALKSLDESARVLYVGFSKSIIPWHTLDTGGSARRRSSARPICRLLYRPADIQPGVVAGLYDRRSLCAPYQADARTFEERRAALAEAAHRYLPREVADPAAGGGACTCWRGSRISGAIST